MQKYKQNIIKKKNKANQNAKQDITELIVAILYSSIKIIRTK